MYIVVVLNGSLFWLCSHTLLPSANWDHFNNWKFIFRNTFVTKQEKLLFINNSTCWWPKTYLTNYWPHHFTHELVCVCKVLMLTACEIKGVLSEFSNCIFLYESMNVLNKGQEEMRNVLVILYVLRHFSISRIHAAKDFFFFFNI